VNSSLAKACATLLLLGSSFLVAIPAVAQSRKAEPPVAEIALSQGGNRLQRLIEGAKKEGALSVYGAMPTTDLQALVDAFAKKYGIKANTWRSSSENVVQRIVTEARSGRFDVDFLQNNEPAMAALQREKLLQQVNSPYHGDLMPQAIPAHKEWVGLYVLAFVQSYNTDKVKKDELPKTYQELLDPKWKGRLGIEADDEHWFAYVLQELGHEKGTRLFKDIVDANGISVRKGHTLLANLVVSGEVPLGLTVYSYMAAQLKRKGAPIDWFVIPPAIAQFTSIGLLKKAPHPHAATLFYDFMLSEGQQILFNRNYVPATTKIDTPLNKLPMKFIDPVLLLDTNDKWLQNFNDVFVKRTK
jgi:iron(III) transport system substrate-binding protein